MRNIRRATGRHFSAEDKIHIVLDGLQGEDSIAELCRYEGIAQRLFMFAGGLRVTNNSAIATSTSSLRSRCATGKVSHGGGGNHARTNYTEHLVGSDQGLPCSASISAEGGVRLIGNALHWAKLFGPHFYFANRGLA